MESWNNDIEALRRLNAELEDCTSKNERVDVLIAACNELGINTFRCIESAVTLCDYHSAHVLIRLSKNTGNDPIAKRWWRDEAGC